MAVIFTPLTCNRTSRRNSRSLCPGEQDQTLKHWASVGKLITDFDISPEGKRAVFAARGDVFTAPAKEGSARNLTRTPGIREKSVAWSPDGRWIAYVSDRTGEDEIYLAPQDGMGKERQVTSGYKGFKFVAGVVAGQQETGLG